MPHWLAAGDRQPPGRLTVVGWLIGRGLGAIERHQEVNET
jgi:hypothetical protein